jgi:hypothetical protein
MATANLYQSEANHVWEVPRGRRNVGGYERVARLGIGTAGAIAAFSAINPVAQAAFAVLGLMGLTTGISGYCPITRSVGWDTYHGGRRRR